MTTTDQSTRGLATPRADTAAVWWRRDARLPNWEDPAAPREWRLYQRCATVEDARRIVGELRQLGHQASVGRPRR